MSRKPYNSLVAVAKHNGWTIEEAFERGLRAHKDHPRGLVRLCLERAIIGDLRATSKYQDLVGVATELIAQHVLDEPYLKSFARCWARRPRPNPTQEMRPWCWWRQCRGRCPSSMYPFLHMRRPSDTPRQSSRSVPRGARTSLRWGSGSLSNRPTVGPRRSRVTCKTLSIPAYPTGSDVLAMAYRAFDHWLKTIHYADPLHEECQDSVSCAEVYARESDGLYERLGIDPATVPSVRERMGGQE